MTDHYEESLDIKILAAERDALEARAERLAEALRRYGVHAWECTAMDIPICTCGLDAALAMGDAPQAPPAAAVPPGYVPVSALIEAREEVESWAAYASPYFQDKHDLAGVLAKIDGQIAAATQAPPAAVSLPAPLPPAPDTMNLTEAQREIEDAFRRGWNSCRATVMQAQPAAAVPDCGACPGDGSMCPKVCRHADENPPIFERLPENEVEAERGRTMNDIQRDIEWIDEALSAWQRIRPEGVP